MKRGVLALGILACGWLFSACAPAGVYVRYGPPAPRYAVVGVAPGVGYVWTDGYWDRRGGNWAWVDGRWARPPHRGAAWVPGRWDEGRRGYEFHRGHWR